MSRLNENLNEILEKINNSLSTSSYELDDITLVTVTKNATIEQIKEANELGLKDIGENKVQKALPQMNELEGLNINWHFIGHLQSNKVKYIIDKVHLIQSLDRHSLASEINNRAKNLARKIDTLVQVNIALEETKYGLAPDYVLNFVEEVLENYPFIRIRGLMTIAPFDEKPESLRPYFTRMRQLFEETGEKFDLKDDFNILSMGMSNDYQIALEEGSNMIRIGSSLFK
ncbi:YggS family pyridoxal phosphate-dependent enzyme [Natranaerofaba carboxydovora]|uniref:YggS family pyridoxal phosphate-dependent enzyme n=1 Tax=Natranaerofaba carboxydovora TaxID=2742683 RepID=UPI001F13BFD7|nr:YggS family pyridoxal phosphate-dependent enzyme [Natranaerofaba carboxydovora]UMZ73270.1 hypothetical protein ACONDI_00823 [Natranaerofaba carboxydovora]